jgi:hypothetical protein
MSRILTAGALLLSTLVLGIAACSDSSNDPSDTDALSESLAQDMGQDVTEDFAELIDASSYDPATGLFLMATAPNGNAIRVPPACVTLSPTPVVNSDSDVVPDSVEFNYDACGFSRAGGFLLDSLSGSIDFIDPQPTAASRGVRHRFHDFTRVRVNLAFPRRSFVAVHNGTREWGGNADTLGHTITDFTSSWTHTGGRTTTHDKDWVAKFVATTPGTIAADAPLPAGTWTASGSSTWGTANRSWSVTLTTPEALQYDPSCTVTPRLTDGTLKLVATRNGVTTNITVAFINCGEYQVTRTAGT